MERKLWNSQEDSVLATLVEQIGITNWTLVAIRLSQRCQGSMRSGKQCRERWFNHLDQTISKKSWNKSEERLLFELHQMHGNKWKEIAKIMKSRTQNDIKNHFYASLRKGIRRINRFLGYKQEAKSIRAIKPSVLALTCDEERKNVLNPQQQKGNQNLFSLILRFAGTEPSMEEADALLSDKEVVKRIEDLLSKMLHLNRLHLHKKEARAQEKRIRKLSRTQGRSEHGNTEIDISEYLNLEHTPSLSGMRSEGYSIKNSSLASENSNSMDSNFSSSSNGMKEEQI